MQEAEFLKDKNIDFPILGLESFKTFLKLCEEVSQHALEDVGLANRANVYKIWTCQLKKNRQSDIKNISNRYSSMKLLSHYLDINIVENNKIGLYIKLDYLNNKQEMSYGITNNKKLFKIGEFDYNISTKLPESVIIKYVLDDIEDFNPREHILLFKIKQDSYTFDPGYCKRFDPQIIKNEILISTVELGNQTEDKLENSQAEQFLEVFKQQAQEYKQSSLITLIVRPRKNKFIDFIIKLK